MSYATKPNLIKIVGDGDWQQVNIEPALRRLAVKEKAGTDDITIKLSETGEELPVKAGEIWDSDYAPEIIETELWVNAAVGVEVIVEEWY